MSTTQRIIHHLRSDLRRNWHLLLLLVIALAAFATMELWRHTQGPQRYHGEFLMIAAFGFGCLMALIIIQGDPATGSAPFWKTRPVREWEIFCSKTIQILAIGLLMFASWNAAPLLTGSGGMTWDFATAIPPLLLGIAAVAALSRNLPQALLVGGGLLAGVAAFAWIWNLATHQLPLFDKSPEMRATGVFLAALTLTAGAIGVMLYHYLRKRQFIAIGAFSIVIAAAFLVMQYSTADFRTRHLGAADEEALGVESASVLVNPDPETFQTGFHTTHTPTRTHEFLQLSSKTTVDGMPGGIFASLIMIDGEIRNPESGAIHPARSGGFRSGRNHYLATLIHHEYDLSWDTPQFPEPDQYVPFLKIRMAQYPTRSEQTWQYQGVAAIQLARMTPLTPVPVGTEAPIRRPGWKAVLSSKKTSPMGVEVRLKASFWRSKGNKRNLPGIACLIVNRKRNEALATRGLGGGGSTSGRLRYFDSNWNFQRSFWKDRERIEISDDWLADAEVVIYVEESLGTIERPVTIDPLKLPKLDLD